MGGVIPFPLSMAEHGDAVSSRAHPHARAAAAAEERKDMVSWRRLTDAARVVRHVAPTDATSRDRKYRQFI